MGENLCQGDGFALGSVFMYERKGDSAVIRRCFSHEECAAVPEQICGLPVSEVGPYCFSAHMDETALRKEFEAGKLRIFPEDAGGNFCLLKADIPRDSSNGLLSEKGIQISGDLIPPLCGNKLKELTLPGSIRRVGRYCLYNCDALELLEFDSALSDWGSGVFTGCHHIKKIRLYLREDGKSSLKQMLDEIPEAVEVEFLSRNLPGQAESVPGNLARLIFPEFYEEGVENTPARILETHVHGSGILYRNCFQSRIFDFQQYDRLFPYAVAREDFEIAARLAAGRLWLPYGLTESARRQYEEYVISERVQFARMFVRNRDMRGIRWLTELAGAAHADLYDLLMELAGNVRFVEAVSFLMESRRMSKKKDKMREAGIKPDRTDLLEKQGFCEETKERNAEAAPAEKKSRPASRRRRFEL